MLERGESLALAADERTEGFSLGLVGAVDDDPCRRARLRS